MTIRHLKIFIAVAETGSMSVAANRLYLTQPTVSQTIRDLEDHYQVQLFERSHKKLFITQEGKQLLNLALMTVGNFDNLELSMRRFQERMPLRVGSSLTVGTCLMSSVISDLEKSHPEMDIYSFVSNTGTGCGGGGRNHRISGIDLCSDRRRFAGSCMREDA